MQPAWPRTRSLGKLTELLHDWTPCLSSEADCVGAWLGHFKRSHPHRALAQYPSSLTRFGEHAKRLDDCGKWRDALDLHRKEAKIESEGPSRPVRATTLHWVGAWCNSSTLDKLQLG